MKTLASFTACGDAIEWMKINGFSQWADLPEGWMYYNPTNYEFRILKFVRPFWAIILPEKTTKKRRKNTTT